MLNYPVERADAPRGSLAPGQGHHDLMGSVGLPTTVYGDKSSPPSIPRLCSPMSVTTDRLSLLRKGLKSLHPIANLRLV